MNALSGGFFVTAIAQTVKGLCSWKQAHSKGLGMDHRTISNLTILQQEHCFLEEWERSGCAGQMGSALSSAEQELVMSSEHCTGRFVQLLRPLSRSQCMELPQHCCRWFPFLHGLSHGVRSNKKHFKNENEVLRFRKSAEELQARLNFTSAPVLQFRLTVSH